MLRLCENFNQDLRGWDTSNVANFSSMLENCYAFDWEICHLSLASATNLTNMLVNTGLSNINYDRTLKGWEAQTPPTGLSITASGLSSNTVAPTAGGIAASAITSLASTYGWSITDDADETSEIAQVGLSDVPSTIDIVLMIGQSNMGGRATSTGTAPASTVAAQWSEHGLVQAADPAGYDYPNEGFSNAAVGSMVPKFATDYAADVGRYPVVVPITKGGTAYTAESAVSNLADNHWGAGSALTPRAIQYAKQCQQYLQDNGKTGTITATVIMLGERDAQYKTANGDYTNDELKAGIRSLIDQLREAFGATHPIYFINIGDECNTATNTVTSGAGWAEVRNAISEVAGEYSGVLVAASAVGYCVSGGHKDALHLELPALESIAADIVDVIAAS